MTTLTITRGLPGSGKTTWAKAILPVRVNRDDLRFATYGQYVLNGKQEDTITVLQQSAVRALLESGRDVVVDDTNLNMRSVKAWQKIAAETGSSFEHVDFEIDLEEAILRCKKRAAHGGRDVPEMIIRRMYDRYRLDKGFPEIKPLPEPNREPYVPDESKQSAWIFDVDGTLTTGPHSRNTSGKPCEPGCKCAYAWHKVGLDVANQPVVLLLHSLRALGYKIIVVSGRDASCAEETLLWFAQHGIAPHPLHMRPEGDTRRDDVIKSEIFDKHIRHQFCVRGVFDDRNQVVDFWRSIGLTCFQVAEGNF